MERRAEDILMNALWHAHFRGGTGRGLYLTSLTGLTDALDMHGFEIVRKAKPAAAGADLLTDVLREAIEDAHSEGYEGRSIVGGEAAARVIQELRGVGLDVVTSADKPALEDAIARFARTVPLTQEAVTAGIQALDRAEAPAPEHRHMFDVVMGWPDFRSIPLTAPAFADVATVTRMAKAKARGKEDRSRWVAYSLEEKRFLAPDEPAPVRFAVGPFEDLRREWRPDEEPVSASDLDRSTAMRPAGKPGCETS